MFTRRRAAGWAWAYPAGAGCSRATPTQPMGQRGRSAGGRQCLTPCTNSRIRGAICVPCHVAAQRVRLRRIVAKHPGVILETAHELDAQPRPRSAVGATRPRSMGLQPGCHPRFILFWLRVQGRRWSQRLLQRRSCHGDRPPWESEPPVISRNAKRCRKQRTAVPLTRHGSCVIGLPRPVAGGCAPRIECLPGSASAPAVVPLT